MVAWVMCARNAGNARRVPTPVPTSAAQQARPKETQNSPVPTALDNGQRSPRKLLRVVVARLLVRKG